MHTAGKAGCWDREQLYLTAKAPWELWDSCGVEDCGEQRGKAERGNFGNSRALWVFWWSTVDYQLCWRHMCFCNITKWFFSNFCSFHLRIYETDYLLVKRVAGFFFCLGVILFLGEKDAISFCKSQILHASENSRKKLLFS